MLTCSPTAVETQSLETQSLETQSLETKSLEAQSLETQSSETQSLETQSLETNEPGTGRVQGAVQRKVHDGPKRRREETIAKVRATITRSDVKPELGCETPDSRARPLCTCRCGCRRRPGRRETCPGCGERVGPGCCWDAQYDSCHECVWQVVDATQSLPIAAEPIRVDSTQLLHAIAERIQVDAM